MSNQNRIKPGPVVVLVVILALSARAGISAVAAPSVKFDKTTADFGQILHGQKTTVVFPFRNVGKGILVITKIDATCGCTTARATKMKLKPGESAQVKIIFDSAHYVGKILKSAYVSSNDPANPVVHLHLTGQIETVVELNPPALELDEMTVGAVVEKTVTITPKTTRKFKILKITSDGKQVTIPKFDKLPGPDGTYTATIKTAAGTSLGRVMEHVSILTDLPGLPPIQFLVYGNVVNAGEENAEHP